MNLPNPIRLFKQSLSAKLFFLLLSMASILVIVGGINIAVSLKTDFKENIRPHLIQYLEYIQADIGSPPNLEKAKEISRQLPVVVNIISPTLNWSSDGENVDLSNIEYYRQYNKDALNYRMGELNSREYLVITQPELSLAFSIPHPHKHLKIKHLIPLIVILLLFLLFYYATKKIFHPISVIESGIKKFGQGELNHRISVNREDELGKLADNINLMSDDIQHMLDAKRNLLLAISHEIRTPVTRSRIAAEMLAEGNYRQSIIDDLNEIDTLTEEILETEKLNNNHATLNKDLSNLSTLTQDVLSKHFSDNTIDYTKNDVKDIQVDDIRIKLLLKNLIGNAIQHNINSNTPPSIEITETKSSQKIKIIDYGKGIPAEHILHLTEPFYRVDPSRKKATDGYGLGLYLCRIIAEAHGGTLSIESKENQGTSIVVELQQ